VLTLLADEIDTRLENNGNAGTASMGEGREGDGGDWGAEGGGPLGGLNILGIVTCLDRLLESREGRSTLPFSPEAKVDTECKDGARFRSCDSKEFLLNAGLAGVGNSAIESSCMAVTPKLSIILAFPLA
jgi:hypothetical protein